MSTEMESMITEARDPDTSFERLVELVKHSEVEVRRALLDNPNLCPTDDQGQLRIRLLEELAKEFPEEVGAHPLFVLHALVEPNEEMIMVVKEVVQRTKDVGLIEQILSTWGPSSWRMRHVVASNPRTPENLLRTLGNQKDEEEWTVRLNVTFNPNTPVDLLRTLGNEQTESDKDVRRAAKEMLAKRGLT